MNTPSATDRRIAMLTTGPVLRTLRGCRLRIAVLDWDDIRRLCRHYNCSIEGLELRMWSGRARAKNRRNNGKQGNDSNE